MKAQAATCLSYDCVHYIPSTWHFMACRRGVEGTCMCVRVRKKTESRYGGGKGGGCGEIDIGKFRGLFVPLPLSES